MTRGVSFDGPRFFLFNTTQLLFTFWEVLVHDGEALLVDLEVLVVLEVMNLNLKKKKPRAAVFSNMKMEVIIPGESNLPCHQLLR